MSEKISLDSSGFNFKKVIIFASKILNCVCEFNDC